MDRWERQWRDSAMEVGFWVMVALFVISVAVAWSVIVCNRTWALPGNPGLA